MSYLKKIYLNWLTVGITIGLIPYVILTTMITQKIGTGVLTLVIPWMLNLIVKLGANEYDR